MGNVYTVSSFSLNVAHVNLNNLSNKINLFEIIRLVHSVSFNVLQGMLNVDYPTAKAAFMDMVMYDNMMV